MMARGHHVREGFRALLVDAGGTLFPDALPDAPGLVEVRVRRLAAILPELDRDGPARLLAELRADARRDHDRLDQRTDATIAERLAALDPDLAARGGDVRRALGRSTGHEPPPFPGHRALLETAGELGLRRVLVSNTDWVSDEDWLVDRMAQRDLSGLLDAVVTSYSLDRRKPDRAMFDRAVALAGCSHEECVYIGDNEGKDIEPAVALGMTVIHVAIQEPPSATRAQHQATSLPAAIQVLRALATAPRPLTKP